MEQTFRVIPAHTARVRLTWLHEVLPQTNHNSIVCTGARYHTEGGAPHRQQMPHRGQVPHNSIRVYIYTV